MPLSIQQIKFELLSYIKEFGGDASCWHIGTAENAAAEMFDNLQLDRGTDIWAWKPAVNAKAADLVTQWFVDRGKASAIDTVEPGPCIFLFKKQCHRAESSPAPLLIG